MAPTDPTVHHSEGPLGEVLREWLLRNGRGAASTLAKETSLTESDLSNWLADRRYLPNHKLMDAIAWLLREERISVNFHLKD